MGACPSGAHEILGQARVPGSVKLTLWSGTRLLLISQQELTSSSRPYIIPTFDEVVHVRVRVSDVRKWAGREERLTLLEPWPDSLHERLDMAAIDEPGQVNVRLRNVATGLVVEVSGQARLHLTCARCLEPAEAMVEFAESQEFREEVGPKDGDLAYERFSGDHIVLDTLIADAVALEIPLAPLCSPGCRGLCPQCGANWNQTSCACEEPPDPRWEALKAWKAED